MKGSRQGQVRTDSASRIRHTLDSLLSTEGVDSESTGEGARFGRYPQGKMMMMVLMMIDVCVCVCVCVCACMYADMHLLVFTWVHVCVFACVWTCTCLCLHVCTSVFLHVCRHALACVYMGVFACVQTCTCLCIHGCVCMCPDMHLPVCAGHAHNLQHDVPVPLCNNYNNNIIIIRLQCAFMQVFSKEFLTLQGWKSGSLLWAPFTA